MDMQIGKKTVEITAKGFLYSISFKEGGRVPYELAGQYTNIPSAEQAVINYNGSPSTEEKD